MRKYAMKAGAALAISVAAAASACEPGSFVVSGNASDPVAKHVVEGTKTNVPLPDALLAVLPPGWSLANPDGLTGPQVSLPPGKALDETLRDLAEQGQVCVTLDTGTKAVRVTAPHAVVAHTATDVPLSALPPELTASVSDEGIYELRVGETLRSAFVRWSKSAGYTLVWEARIDLPVEAPVTFAVGTRFDDAVKQTLGAFWRTKHSLIGRLYKNRVLVVSGRNA